VSYDQEALFPKCKEYFHISKLESLKWRLGRFLTRRALIFI